ncbi:MAG: RNA ligase RtcB family protein [Campylobacterota bacterium]|nr:RNA ligase RtcB family protein [Campylobacterota bacterium]
MDKLKIIASKSNWIDSRSVETLEKITHFRGVQHIVGLPDLSVGYVPNGMAIVVRDRIYPHLIGGDIGCGMSLFEVSVKPRKIKVDKFVKQLSRLESLDDIEVDMPRLGYHLGSIGKGNHFAELHLVDEVIDREIFEKLELNDSSLYVLIHSGSRAFGQMVFDSVAGGYEPSEGMDAQSSKAQEYLQKHNQAILYAKHSRAEIARKLLKAIRLDVMPKPISDTAHNSIIKQDDNWLHRKGATPTDSGAVIIAGSRGSLSYLVMPTDTTSLSNYSLAHGAGRKWERSSAEAKLRNRYTKKHLKRSSIGSRVICSDSKLLYEEAPQAYKNIDVVIDDLVEAGLARVIASFRPILTYKES